MKKKKIETKIDDNLPADKYTKVSVSLMNALASGEFGALESLLNNDVRTVCCGHRTMKGKTRTMNYWRGWRQRYVETSIVTSFEVVRSNYYSHACLKTDNTIVMFQIGGDLVSAIILSAVKTSEYVDDDKLNYPLDVERIKQYLEPLPTTDDEGTPIDTTNRMPCLHCGIESSDLLWYKSTRPGFFNRNWNIGQVSVCPQCGLIVEYKHVKTTELETDKNKWVGPKRPNNGNEYSAIASKIYSERMIELLDEERTSTFVSYLLSQLTDVEVESACTLELRMPKKTGCGDNSHLSIRYPNGEKTEDIIYNLIVKPTEMAAWQLYLLKNIAAVLPYYWHGGYNRCTYIFQESDIDGIVPLKFHDLSELSAQDLFVPSVEKTIKNGQCCTMLVRCCHWNDWNGLVKEEVSIMIENGHCVSYERTTVDLFKYNCGLWY
jgi:hypothetical protein